MSKITSIESQKLRNRVNIYLDDKFAFGTDLHTLLKEGLKVGMELTEKQVETIVKMSEFQISYDKILKFATMRPRSEREFNYWIIKHKIHTSLKEELFNRLKRLQLLDDEKFASWWVGQRLEFHPKSRRLLALELKFKGISKDIIDKVFSEMNIDENLAIKKLLAKKSYKWRNLTGFEKRKKIYGFLAQNGFDSETIKDILAKLTDD